MSVHQKKDGRWFVIQYVDGRQKWHSFGRGPGAKKRAELFNAGLGLGKPADTSPTFSQIVNRYLAAKIGTSAASTIENQVVKFGSVILPALGHLQAGGLGAETLDKYVATRLRSVKRTTVRRELADIQAALNWAAGRGLINANPVAGYKPPPKDDAIISPPTLDEVRAILAAASEHLARAIRLAYYTGLRPGEAELLRLKYSDVNFEANYITVRSAAKGGPRMRQVPLHFELAQRLRQWYEVDKRPADGYIIHWRNKPVRRLKTAWDAAKRRAGITRRLRMYDLRHAAITEMLRHGGDMKNVSAIAGHSRPDTTLRVYAHVSTAASNAVVQCLPTLDKND